MIQIYPINSKEKVWFVVNEKKIPNIPEHNWDLEYYNDEEIRTIKEYCIYHNITIVTTETSKYRDMSGFKPFCNKIRII